MSAHADRTDSRHVMPLSCMAVTPCSATPVAPSAKGAKAPRADSYRAESKCV